MNWPAYADYRATGMRWLSEIPAGWSFEKFRYCFRESNEKNGVVPVGEMLSVSGYRGVEVKQYDDDNRRRTAEELEDYRVVRVGQLAVNTMWLNYAGLGVSEFEGHISPAYRSYWIAPDFNRRYVHYLMRSAAYVDGYTALLTGVRPNSLQMSRDDLMGFPVLRPPAADQLGIATFLDRETAKIDALIGKQEQLIATLREDRAATIIQAVTNGLDPDVEMKDSGAGWIGDVPAHWSVAKIKHGFSVTLGKMFQGEAQAAVDVQLPHLKAGSLTTTGLSLDDPLLCWFSPGEIRSLTLRKGDILVVEGGAIGRCVVLDRDLDGWGFQKSLNRVRALHGDSPEFLAYLIEAATLSGHVSILCGRATIPHFTAEKLAALEWPHPGVDEQVAIAAFLKARCAEIDALITKSTEMIETLREYRSALITDAVTGRIDVRKVA